ncbi:hypothetical protein PQX77_014217 [Marasmius sp. AFHP31]|nr:hypothetical protein PQX77_014217 [Marasmius sp. AFHP31]
MTRMMSINKLQDQRAKGKPLDLGKRDIRTPNVLGSLRRKRKGELDDEDGGDEHSPPSSKPKVIATDTGKGNVAPDPAECHVDTVPPQSTVSSDMRTIVGRKEEDKLGNLLDEALLTLANLTKDGKNGEELYARAEKESGGKLLLGGTSHGEDGR